MVTVYREFPGTLNELQRHLGIREFHATEILSGKGILRSVPITKRFAVFEFLAHIFAQYRFPLIVQTVGEQTIAEHSATFRELGVIGPFDFTSPVDAGLLLLLGRVKQHLRNRARNFAAPSVIAVDEGRMANGAFVRIPALADFAEHSGIFFRRSTATFPIQLADFAAFGLNRMQWLAAKDKRSDRENTELRILASASFNFVNVPSFSLDLATWQGEDYDEFHVKDRTAKGLPLPNPRKKTEG